MYVQCPECLTIFKLGGAELAAAGGRVRCGHCAAGFDALRTLTDQLPPEPIEYLDTHPAGELPPQLDLPVFRPNPAQAMLFVAPAERALAAERSTLPAFAAARRRARAAHRTLAGRLRAAGADPARRGRLGRTRALARRRAHAPWLDAACARLGCTLPLRRDASALTLLSRDIRPHPSVEGALIVSATVRNDADFAQAYPTVDITLSDLDEKRIAMRRFAPREYLGDTRGIERGLAAGASAALVFEVADPGRNAVAFEFKFE